MSGGNCPGGNCPGGNCPRTTLYIYGHECKFLVKQINEEVYSSSVDLEEKVQKVTNLLIQVNNECLRMVKIKNKKSKNHDSDC